MRELLAAFAFYTILPVGHGELRFERIARWLPAVGIVVGLLVAGVMALLIQVFPTSIAALLSVLFWFALTGGLHFDGLLDTADGWAAGSRRLEAMADSTVGAYAVAAGFAVLSIKGLVLAALGSAACGPILIATTTARWGQVMAIGGYPYLKAEGKGRFHKQYMRWPTDGITASLQLVGMILFTCLTGSAPIPVLQTTAAACAAALLVSWSIARKFGGQTGDTYGAVVEATEAIALLLCTLFERSTT